MTNLSAELLKIETGKFHLHAVPFNIDLLLRRIADTTRPVFIDKGLSIFVQCDAAANESGPVMVLGEATFCYSIFQNLLKNACEAAPPKSMVSIRIHVGADVQVEVKNNGAVPASIRDQFFEKYVSVGKRDGTGLGTYSARLLTEAQTGSIDCTVSDADDTTVITVRLPKA